MSEPRYISKSQQRVLQMQFVLAGNELYGLAPGEIATAMAIGQSQVTRDLANLEAAGIAERVPETHRWWLSPRVGQIGLSMLESLDKAQRKVDEIRQRYSRLS